MNILLNQMLLMLKSGYSLKKKFIKIYKFNNLCLNVLYFLYKEGYILCYNYDNLNCCFYIFLKYNNNLGAFHNLFLYSKFKNKIYINYNLLKNYQSNMGMYVLSTSKGILSVNEAIEKKTGGVLLFFIF